MLIEELNLLQQQLEDRNSQIEMLKKRLNSKAEDTTAVKGDDVEVNDQKLRSGSSAGNSTHKIGYFLIQLVRMQEPRPKRSEYVEFEVILSYMQVLSIALIFPCLQTTFHVYPVLFFIISFVLNPCSQTCCIFLFLDPCTPDGESRSAIKKK